MEVGGHDWISINVGYWLVWGPPLKQFEYTEEGAVFDAPPQQFLG